MDRDIFNTRLIAVCLLAFTLLMVQETAALDVISNSADWRDVYSSILYSNLLGASSHFLTSTPHGPILLYEIPSGTDGVEVITSADRPFYVGYESLMNSRGFDNVEEFIFESANLELARRLTNINNFIILDDAYGYNALAVAPFAAKARYYVLFANSGNIDDIAEFLATKQVDNIIIYGRTDREVRNALSQYNPEILSSDSGSRFENNMLILDKFAQIGSVRQVILTNGEFIESSMMTGNEAVVFIGRNNVPDEIKEYIKNKGIEIGVLIGNELIGTATDIRRQLGISVFVKFARGSRIPGGTINPVEDLDRFPMPSYGLSMSIESISYNRATGLLEVTYTNNEPLAVFFKSTITVKNEAGETVVVEGDELPVFLDGEETKTVVYNKLGKSGAQNLAGDLSGEVYTIFGESKTSLENVLRGTFGIDMIDVRDDTDIEIIKEEGAVYDKARKQFLITIENTGEVDAYVSVELVDVRVNGELVTVSSNEPEKVEVGKRKAIPVKIDMEDEDLTEEANEEIDVQALFGERKQSLIKVKRDVLELKQTQGISTQYLLAAGALVILILLILFFFLFKRGKKTCPRCRTKNDKDAHTCKKCGHQFSSHHH